MNFLLGKLKISLLCCVLLAIDLVTKIYFQYHQCVVTSFLKFQPHQHYEQFNLLPYIDEHSLQFSVFFYFLAIVMMTYFFTQYYNRVTLVSVGLILTGIIGNLIDKLLFGYIRTFIDFYVHPAIILLLVQTDNIPIFNLADVYFFIGATIFSFNKKW